MSWQSPRPSDPPTTSEQPLRVAFGAGSWVALFFLTLLAVVLGILIANYIWSWLVAMGLKGAGGG